MSHARITPDEAARLMREEGYAYLDVRSEQEFALEHAKGAYNVPLRRESRSGMVDNPDFMRVVRALFAREDGVVVGCRSGNRSRTAAALLVQAGFTRVVEQRAGHEGTRDPFGRAGERGWRAAGLPCATEPEPGRDYASLRERAG